MNEKAIEELVKSSKEIEEVESYYRLDITEEVMYEMYVVKRMSTHEIAKELGCSQWTVNRKLKEFDIRTRSISEAKRDEAAYSAEWTQFQKEVLDGLILGDGNIHINKRCVSAYYQQSCKHKEFLGHVMGILPSIFGENNPYIHREGLWDIRSKSNKYLTEQYYRYYPEEVKVIPEDIKITPTVLLYWYLGDGTLNDNNQVFIACTSLYGGLDLVIPQLEEMGLYFRKWEGCIGLPKECNDRFFEVTGEKPPVECYLYKWPSKYLTSEEMVLAHKYKRGLL